MAAVMLPTVAAEYANSAFTIFAITLRTAIMPSPRMINVRRDIRWTRCVPLNETTFHFEEIAMLNAISRTATTYHAA
jgi:hypothetical protein